MRSHDFIAALALALAILVGPGACSRRLVLGGNPLPGGFAGASGGTGGTAPCAPTADLDLSRCGNGLLDPGEQCDDRNHVDRDGCSSLCQIEPGFACPSVGALCVPSTCGDSRVAADEACDDGNVTSGDGCSADCRTLEPGWQCGVAGRKCTPLCGDGLLLQGEECDDGNIMSGDGCSSACHPEPGVTCTGVPSRCPKATCGNGKVETGEECDDGAANGVFRGDGTACTTTCVREPQCRAAGGGNQACVGRCGDGVIDPGEACDDGNRTDGDGCTAACRIEATFTCQSQPRSLAQPCTQPGASGLCRQVPVTYRDFRSEKEPGGHPDFQYLGTTDAAAGVTRWCVPNAAGPARQNDSTTRCWDIAGAQLANGKPTLSAGAAMCSCQFTDLSSTAGNTAPTSPLRTLMMTNPEMIISAPDGHPRWIGQLSAVASASSFAEWFTTGPSTTQAANRTLELALLPPSPSRLAPNDAYRFVSPSGSLSGGYFPFDPPAPAAGPAATTSAAGEPLLCGLYPYWSDSFPGCQGQQWVDPAAVPALSPACGVSCPGASWKAEKGALHDYWFTQEIHLPFVMTSTGAELLVVATDDLWVYVNGILVLDLGGTHDRIPGKVTITGTPGNATTIEGGNMNADGTIMPCTTVDPFTGVQTIPEVDCRGRSIVLGLKEGSTYELAIFGANRRPVESSFVLQLAGFGLGQSTSVCAPPCGDGVRTANEECDLGMAANDDQAYGGCTTACKLGPRCGDGHVDPGEDCDLGPNNRDGYSGATAGCTRSCRAAPFCGDGHVDDPLEQCDLGALNDKAIVTDTPAPVCPRVKCTGACLRGF